MLSIIDIYFLDRDRTAARPTLNLAIRGTRRDHKITFLVGTDSYS